MSINTNTITDPNLRFVNDYENPPQDINGNEWDYVYGFFKKMMKTDAAAEDFSLSIFRVSKETGYPVTDIIQTMEGQTGMQLNASLAYYLNSIRSSATLLGVQSLAKPNFYAGRAVLI